MATVTPSDPRQLLEDAANGVAAFNSVRQDVFWDELPQGDLPGWALDPREQEGEQGDDSVTVDRGVYGTVPIQYICYIGVESGHTASARSSARSDLDTYRNQYLDELFQTVLANNSAVGRAEKTGRVRFEIEQGEQALIADALSIEFLQSQDFTT